MSSLEQSRKSIVVALYCVVRCGILAIILCMAETMAEEKKILQQDKHYLSLRNKTISLYEMKRHSH